MRYLLLLALLAITASISAQSLKLDGYFAHDTTATLPAVSPSFLPGYALANPSGHSFLCRVEDKVLAKSPFPVWIKLADEAKSDIPLYQNAAIRYRVFRLSK